MTRGTTPELRAFVANCSATMRATQRHWLLGGATALTLAAYGFAAFSASFARDRDLVTLAFDYAPRPLFLIPPLLLAALAAWRRARAAWGAALACGVLAIFPIGKCALPSRPAAASGIALRVAQYNVEQWAAGAGPIARVIDDAAPDIVCLEEAGEYFWRTRADQRARAIEAELPGYAWAREGEIAVGVRVANARIVTMHVEALPAGPPTRPLVDVLVAREGVAVSVLAVHLLPTLPHLGVSDRPILENADARRAQVERVRAYAARIPRPVVLCGDFNAPPSSAHARDLSSDFDDAWRRRGVGFGFTTPSDAPYQRFDYVFTRGLGVRDARVLAARASDHRPVVVELVVPPQ